MIILQHFCCLSLGCFLFGCHSNFVACNSSGRSLCFWLRLTGFFVNGFFFSLVLFRPFFSLRGSTLAQRDHFDRTHSAPNRGGEGERAGRKGGEIAAVVGDEPVRRGRRSSSAAVERGSGGCGVVGAGRISIVVRRARPQGKRRSPKSLAVLLLLAVNDVFREW
jgi:hypothetical protein